MSRGVLGWVLCALAMVLAAPACATDTVYYYYTDTLHSAVAVTDAQGNVIERTTYAPYGQVLNRDLRDGPGYGGHAEDPETQLVYMQQRYYDAQSGRFLSVDPVAATEDGGNFNRYAYAKDNPYRYTDPFGMYECSGSKNDCGTVGKFVSTLNKALKNMDSKSSNYQKLSAISKYLGKAGDKNGVTISVGALGKNVLGQASPGDKGFTVDVKKFNNLPVAFARANPGKSSGDVEDALGAGVVAHESQHELDHRSMTGGRPDGRAQARATEENAYGIESAVGKALGTRIGYETDQQIQNGVQQSTNAFCAKSAPQC